MLSSIDDALEWLDRAEQMRAVAGQLSDWRSHRNKSRDPSRMTARPRTSPPIDSSTGPRSACPFRRPTPRSSPAFLYGIGANGKSVFINTLMGILKDYAAAAPMSTFMACHTDQHPTDLAML